MNALTKQFISGGSSRPSAGKIEENNLMPSVIDGLKSVLSDKEEQINELNDWSKIYDFISYHIATLSASDNFDKVQSLKQLIMLDANLALSYLVEQSKIDDVTIIETFEQVFQSFSHIKIPGFMNCLLHFIENIPLGGDVLTKLSSLVIQLLDKGYQIESMMDPTVFQKIFNNMDDEEKNRFICYLINKNLISYHSIDTILNMESIIIDISRDTSCDISRDTNPSIIFIYSVSREFIGTMIIRDLTDLSKKILLAIKANESGGGKLKNLVSVIEILLHKKIVFDESTIGKSTIDESTFIKMINNFDKCYSIILMTKHLLNMKDNNLSFLTAKNRILRKQISLFLSMNIHWNFTNTVDLTNFELNELSSIYSKCDNDNSNINFNDELIRRLLLQVMNHHNHLYLA